MVMGPTHALSGLAVGLAASNLAPLLGQPMNIPTALVLGGLCAGAAIAPDLDHPKATASQSIGVVSALGSAVVQSVSANVYRHTRTRRDRNNADGHRGITHTPLVGVPALGVIFGTIPAIAGLWGNDAGRWAVAVIIWLFLVWALRALPPKHRPTTDYITATFLTGAAYLALRSTYAEAMPLFVGLAIALGALVHTLGDALTDYGAPLFFPFVIKGERWYGSGLPKPLRFKAGKWVENKLIFPLFVLGAFVALLGIIPGALPLLGGAISTLWSAISLLWA